MDIKLTTFVDYALTAGTGRITSVKQIKAPHAAPVEDFYKPAREAIIDMHERGEGGDALDDLLQTRTDRREQQLFPKVVNGYKKFLRQGKMTWFEPPMRDYRVGPISVRVAPEVGLLIDGRPHAIKLYFRGEPISPQRILLTNTLLGDALHATWPGTVFATLDVRRARLYTHHPKTEVGLLLKAEAASLSSLLHAL